MFRAIANRHYASYHVSGRSPVLSYWLENTPYTSDAAECGTVSQGRAWFKRKHHYVQLISRPVPRPQSFPGPWNRLRAVLLR